MDRARREPEMFPGRVADYPGNPRQRPKDVEKISWAADDVQQRREMLATPDHGGWSAQCHLPGGHSRAHLPSFSVDEV
jgi:hypothetical protein